MLLTHRAGIILCNSVSKMRSFLMLNLAVYMFTTMLERVNGLGFSFLWDFRCISGRPFAMPFMNFAKKPFELIFRNVSKAGLDYYYYYYYYY
jgi:hypothetical protein